MRSHTRYGLDAAGFADTFCNAVLMLLNMSFLLLTVSFIPVRHCCITSVISWNVTVFTVMIMSVRNSAAAGAAAAADFRKLSSASTRDVA